MSLARRAARRDVNEPQIIQQFRDLGCVVEQLSAKGVPDLMVHFLGDVHLVEVKHDNEPLTPDQKRWHDAWAKGGSIPDIVRTEAHARKLVRIWTMVWAEQQGAAARNDDDRDPVPQVQGQVNE